MSSHQLPGPAASPEHEEPCSPGCAGSPPELRLPQQRTPTQGGVQLPPAPAGSRDDGSPALHALAAPDEPSTAVHGPTAGADDGSAGTHAHPSPDAPSTGVHMPAAPHELEPAPPAREPEAALPVPAARQAGDDGQLSSVATALAAVTDALADLAVAPTWKLDDRELAECVRVCEAARRRLEAQTLRLVAEADHRGTPLAHGMPHTAAWLAALTNGRGSDAAHRADLAVALTRHRALSTALDAGQMSLLHAEMATRALREIADHVAPEVLDDAEQLLVEQAALLDPRDYRVVIARLLATVDPDGSEPPDAERARAARAFRISDARRDGLRRVTGWLDDDGAATVLAALTPLAGPAPAGPDRRPDPRPAERRMADALVDVARLALSHDGLPAQGGQRPQVVVTVPLQVLEDRLAGVAVMDFAGPITAETARLYACDAEVTPVVLSASGIPLDVGRTSRIVTSGLRRALAVRDGGCAFAGCQRPVAWTEAHHIVPWARGGTTQLHNLVLLCRTHHEAVHGGGWNVRLGRDDRPEFQPPWLVDPDQVWRPANRHP